MQSLTERAFRVGDKEMILELMDAAVARAAGLGMPVSREAGIQERYGLNQD